MDESQPPRKDPAPTIDPSQTIADNLLRSLEREVWIVTAGDGSHRAGCLATGVWAASIDPAHPTVVVAIAVNHHTHRLIAASGAFAVHLLGPEQIELAYRFASQSGHSVDKFAGLAVTVARTGSPIVSACANWIDCRVLSRMAAGTRTLFLGEVLAAAHVPGTFLTDRQLFARLSMAEQAILKQQFATDIATQQPLWDAWRATLSAPASLT